MELWVLYPAFFHKSIRRSMKYVGWVKQTVQHVFWLCHSQEFLDICIYCHTCKQYLSFVRSKRRVMMFIIIIKDHYKLSWFCLIFFVLLYQQYWMFKIECLCLLHQLVWPLHYTLLTLFIYSFIFFNTENLQWIAFILIVYFLFMHKFQTTFISMAPHSLLMLFSISICFWNDKHWSLTG